MAQRPWTPGAQVQVQHEQLSEVRTSIQAQRDHDRDLFELAPAAYLITDTVGVIQEANRRAVSLLGAAQHVLVGRPLAMYVTAEERWRLRDRLGRLESLDSGSWELQLQPRHHEPVQVTVSASVARNQAGEVTGLRWLLRERRSPGPSPTQEPATSTTEEPGASPTLRPAPTVSAGSWQPRCSGTAGRWGSATPSPPAPGAGPRPTRRPSACMRPCSASWSIR